MEQVRPAPTALACTSYMVRAATLGDYAEALGVALPGYWINQGGECAAGSPLADLIYRCWIETYGGEGYASVVEAVLTEMDRVGEGLTPAKRAAVHEDFITGSCYEWIFWNMRWTLEEWPV